MFAHFSESLPALPSPVMAMQLWNTHLLGSLHPSRRADRVSVPLVPELCSPFSFSSYVLNRCFSPNPSYLGHVSVFCLYSNADHRVEYNNWVFYQKKWKVWNLYLETRSANKPCCVQLSSSISWHNQRNSCFLHDSEMIFFNYLAMFN